MSRLTIRNSTSWSCSVSLLDRARELNIDFDAKPFDKLVGRIERLKYVDYVEDRHQFWATIDPDTANMEVARNRVQRVLDKIEALLLKAKKDT